MKIYFHTFGCKVNQYETQLLRERICINGNQSVDDIKQAGLCIINSCTVTHNADADARQIIRRIKNNNPGSRIVMTGCYLTRASDELKKLFPEVIFEKDKDKIPERIGQKLPCQVHTISFFHAHQRAFVKIQDGCNAYCSYCIVPYVRNKLYSKSRELVFEEINSLVKNGYKEVVLCGICLGKFRDSENYGLTELVKDILEKFPGLKLHFSSLEMVELTDELIGLIADNKRIVRHLHIPLQSGDDEILKLMNRPYTSAQFQKRLKYILKNIPDMKITTDVMVGFPTESKKQFENTYNFLINNRFNDLHVFRYSPRPGTKAVKMKSGITSREIKARARLLATTLKNLTA